MARLTVRLGDHNIFTSSEVKHVERKIKRVVRHKGFDSRTLYNDIAILTMDQPVTFSKGVRPVCLPSGGGARLYNGLTGTVVGWGSLAESQYFSSKNYQQKSKFETNLFQMDHNHKFCKKLLYQYGAIKSVDRNTDMQRLVAS